MILSNMQQIMPNSLEDAYKKQSADGQLVFRLPYNLGTCSPTNSPSCFYSS